MYEIDCPHCGTTNELEGEQLPERACDTEETECGECGSTFKFGWYAELELRS